MTSYSNLWLEICMAWHLTWANVHWLRCNAHASHLVMSLIVYTYACVARTNSHTQTKI